MNINPFQMMQMMRNANNPQQLVVNLLRPKAGNNQILNNALNCLQNGQYDKLEEMAKNGCNERGLNINDSISQIKNQFGLS